MEKSDPQQRDTAAVTSAGRTPSTVKFCPAHDKSSESSPTADERTANTVSDLQEKYYIHTHILKKDVMRISNYHTHKNVIKKYWTTVDI
jgi:hypothetical protein